MITLDDAIKHCEEKSCGNTECAQDHKQLATWLTELKHLREWKAKIMQGSFDSEVVEGSLDASISGSLPVLSNTDMILLPQEKFKVGDSVKVIVLTKGQEESIEVSTSAETPLTADLLLQYGFETEISPDGIMKYVMYDEYREIELREYSDSIWIFNHHDVEFSTPDTQITISHLHEFRQALQLCGCIDILTPIPDK